MIRGALSGAILGIATELAITAKPTVIKFSVLSNDSGLQVLVQRDHSEALDKFLYGKDVVDLLQDYPGVVRDAQLLVDLLPPLKARLYSISSSLAAFPEEVHLTIAVVRYEYRDRRRGGLASTWFADRVAIGDGAPVYVHENPRFRLPPDPGTPIIMIGPGTGIAPFRAFLHHRRKQGFTGRTWLFFGERHAKCDFLYRSELESFLAAHELSRTDTAFSRDQHQKIYVQHRMIEAGKESWSWLQDGARIYVCGDATHMAKDVDAALQAIIVKHGRRSGAQAKLEMHALAAEGRLPARRVLASAGAGRGGEFGGLSSLGRRIVHYRTNHRGRGRVRLNEHGANPDAKSVRAAMRRVPCAIRWLILLTLLIVRSER